MVHTHLQDNGPLKRVDSWSTRQRSWDFGLFCVRRCVVIQLMTWTQTSSIDQKME